MGKEYQINIKKILKNKTNKVLKMINKNEMIIFIN